MPRPLRFDPSGATILTSRRTIDHVLNRSNKSNEITTGKSIDNTDDNRFHKQESE